MLMVAHNFPQTASNTIANDCPSKAPARNKADARRARILHRESAEHHELTAVRMAPFFYTSKLRNARQAPRFGERKRAGLQHGDFSICTTVPALRLYSKSLPPKISGEDFASEADWNARGLAKKSSWSTLSSFRC